MGKKKNQQQHQKSPSFHACPNSERGCKKVPGNLQEQEEHLEQCAYRLVTCPQNCGLQVEYRYMVEHLSHVCSRKTKNCPQCKQDISENQFSEHKETCLKKVDKTQNNIIQKNMGRKNEECKMKFIGCDFKGSGSEVEAHQKDSEAHFSMFMSYLIKQNEMNETLSKRLDKFEARINSLSDFFERKNNELHSSFPPHDSGPAEKQEVDADVPFENYLDNLDKIQKDFDDFKIKLENIKEGKIPSNKKTLSLMPLETRVVTDYSIDKTTLDWTVKDFSNVKSKITLQGPYYETRTNELGFRPELFLNAGRNHMDIGLWIHQEFTDTDEPMDWPTMLTIEILDLVSRTSLFFKAITVKDGFNVLDDNSGLFYIENYITYEELEKKAKLFLKGDSLALKYTIV